ncbi:SOS response-associated peptidase [Salinarchaeum sp. IM2453]|uniref:SOS response-associated peptidase n=1 Tax=Salinarchaeum sp. IM2453 TaxID=2862870 RepID=UPI001C83F0E8|nr:SOS response-associated peptidase [Salinarchaeum sp. IM2453]QZA87896.1 SOS response-associated peptidase [Salinarchaeum sp. IM2453]
MCGRTSLFIDQNELEDRFDATIVADGGYIPRYNIAPGDDLYVITNESSDEIVQRRWGLIPFWANGPDNGIINARSETVHKKSVFDQAWESNPCLVLSSGFYEWKTFDNGQKQPYRVYRSGESAFAMAGLWDVWENDGRSIRTVTILTTEANSFMSSLHDRMPVILPREAESTWLSSNPDVRQELCQPYPANDLDAYEISTQVNNPSNDHEQIIEPLSHEQSGLSDFQ